MSRSPAISASTKAPSAGSVLSTALRVPAGIDWSHESGLEYVPEGCGPASRWDYCDPEVTTKQDSVFPDEVQFKPFVIYYPEGCSILSMQSPEYMGRARRGLTAHESHALAFELAHGTLNISLQSEAVDSSSSPINAIPETLAGLIEDMQACGYDGDVWFHAPGKLLPLFLQQNLLEERNGVFYVGNHIVIFDAGTGNIGPDNAIDEDLAGVEPPAGSAWIYASGPVEVALGEVRELDAPQAGFAACRNDVYVVAERPALVRFDNCCVFAALASAC